MQIDNLSWFPGHMTKTKRMISAEIKIWTPSARSWTPASPCPPATRTWTS